MGNGVKRIYQEGKIRMLDKEQYDILRSLERCGRQLCIYQVHDARKSLEDV